MSTYRILCMMRPAQKQKRRRQVTKHLFTLELIVWLFLMIFHTIGAILSGTTPAMSFWGRGNLMTMDHIIKQATGTSQWTLEVGIKCLNVFVFYMQVFVVLEMVSDCNEMAQLKNVYALAWIHF